MIGAKIGGFANPDLFVQAKRIYFAQCNASLDRNAFIARWRRHGKLAMHFMAAQHWENVLRYVHCDAVRDTALAGIDEQWDGMGILLFRDSAARRRHIGVPVSCAGRMSAARRGRALQIQPDPRP